MARFESSCPGSNLSDGLGWRALFLASQFAHEHTNIRQQSNSGSKMSCGPKNGELRFPVAPLSLGQTNENTQCERPTGTTFWRSRRRCCCHFKSSASQTTAGWFTCQSWPPFSGPPATSTKANAMGALAISLPYVCVRLSALSLPQNGMANYCFSRTHHHQITNNSSLSLSLG